MYEIAGQVSYDIYHQHRAISDDRPWFDKNLLFCLIKLKVNYRLSYLLLIAFATHSMRCHTFMRVPFYLGLIYVKLACFTYCVAFTYPKWLHEHYLSFKMHLRSHSKLPIMNSDRIVNMSS